MPDSSREQPDMLATIDLYLAGELAPEAREEFERCLAAQPVLHAECKAQRDLIDSLRRAVPAATLALAAAQLAHAKLVAGAAPVTWLTADAATANGQSKSRRHAAASKVTAGERSVPPSGRRRLALVVATAAALLLALSYSQLFTKSQGPLPPADLVSASSFSPTIAQSEAKQLEMMIASKLGEPLKLPVGGSIVYLGVRADLPSSPLGFAILATSGGKQVVIQLDRCATATADGAAITGHPSADATRWKSEVQTRETGVFRHEGTVGTLSIIEWSASPTPLIAGGIVAR